MSADQGNTAGQNSYGLCLENGEGVSKDLKEFPSDAPPGRIVKLIDNFRPEIPKYVNPPIRDIIEGCWSKDAERRPSCDEIYTLLEDASFIFFDDVFPLVVKRFICDVEGK
jgi:hypothetical protein